MTEIEVLLIVMASCFAWLGYVIDRRLAAIEAILLRMDEPRARAALIRAATGGGL